jgi:hypothetical protein
VAHAEGAVVGELAAPVGLAAADEVDGLDEGLVADLFLLQEGVLLGVEEAAVVAGDAEGAVELGVVAVDDVEEGVQLAPVEGGARRRGEFEIGDLLLDAAEAVVGAVLVVVEGEEPAALAVEDEEEAVEEVEAVVVDVPQVLWAQFVRRQVEEALHEALQRPVDVVLQVLLELDGVLVAGGQGVVEEDAPAGVGPEGGLAEEEGEGAEPPGVGFLEELDEVDFVIDLEAVAGVAVDEAPERAVGEDAPG